MKSEDQILKEACREQYHAGEEMDFIADKEQLRPVTGINVFDMAVLMAMQGYCQFSSKMPGDVLLESIVNASIKTAKAILIAIQRERELLFPDQANPADDDLPF